MTLHEKGGVVTNRGMHAWIRVIEEQREKRDEWKERMKGRRWVSGMPKDRTKEDAGETKWLLAAVKAG